MANNRNKNVQVPIFKYTENDYEQIELISSGYTIRKAWWNKTKRMFNTGEIKGAYLTIGNFLRRLSNKTK